MAKDWHHLCHTPEPTNTAAIRSQIQHLESRGPQAPEKILVQTDVRRGTRAVENTVQVQKDDLKKVGSVPYPHLRGLLAWYMMYEPTSETIGLENLVPDFQQLESGLRFQNPWDPFTKLPRRMLKSTHPILQILVKTSPGPGRVHVQYCGPFHMLQKRAFEKNKHVAKQGRGQPLICYEQQESMQNNSSVRAKYLLLM